MTNTPRIFLKFTWNWKVSSTITKRNTQKKTKTRTLHQTNKLLQIMYYEVDRPSALGGVDKLDRVMQRYGLKRTQVLNWLWQQPGYTLYKPARTHFCRNRVILFDIDSQWQSVLVDLQHLSRWNKGYKYLITCIDVLSKYVWVVPLKWKTGASLVTAFESIFEQGKEQAFWNLPKNENVHHL